MSEAQPIVTRDNLVTPDQMLARAVEAGHSIEVIEKMMDLQERWQRGLSEQEFNKAFTAMQGEMPPIEKTVKGHNAKYAPLEELVPHAQQHMGPHGFSHSFRFEDTADMMRVTCILAHINGATRENSMSAAPDDSGGKNKIQARASANSYLMRYTFIGVLGLVIRGEDNDGGRPAVVTDELLKYNALVREHWQTVAFIKGAVNSPDCDWSQVREAIAEIHDNDGDAAVETDWLKLWRAPTRGGIWTTAERTVIKENAGS